MGRFFAENETLDKLFQNDQVWLNYKTNPNGSLRDVAGILNETKNVAALMPHSGAGHARMDGRDDR